MTDITDRDVAFQVEQALPPKGSLDREGIDADATTAAVTAHYGLVNVDTIDHDEFWQIVREHDASQS